MNMLPCNIPAGVGSVVQGNGAGDDGSNVGVHGCGGGRGDEMRPPGAPLRPGEPGGPADHAGGSRDAAWPRVELRGAVEACIHLHLRELDGRHCAVRIRSRRPKCIGHAVRQRDVGIRVRA